MAEEQKKEVKKKRKRRKKPGPKKKRKYYYISKKKRKEMEEKELNRKRISFKIIHCHNGRENRSIKHFYNIEDAYTFLNQLKEENKNTIFPRTMLTAKNHGTKSNTDEYVLLERNRNGDKKNLDLRNEFGKLVPHKVINSDRWVIIDKIPALTEETFWVFGLDSKRERKDIRWIYENIVGREISKYDAIRVLIYKNKIVVKDDSENMDLIICKTQIEGGKLYNKLEELAKKDKRNNIFFIGSYNRIGERQKRLILEIMELTGWSRLKVLTSSTRKCRKEGY